MIFPEGFDARGRFLGHAAVSQEPAFPGSQEGGSFARTLADVNGGKGQDGQAVVVAGETMPEITSARSSAGANSGRKAKNGAKELSTMGRLASYPHCPAEKLHIQWFYKKSNHNPSVSKSESSDRWVPYGPLENTVLERAWQVGIDRIEFGAGIFPVVISERKQYNESAKTHRSILRGTWFFQVCAIGCCPTSITTTCTTLPLSPPPRPLPHPHQHPQPP